MFICPKIVLQFVGEKKTNCSTQKPELNVVLFIYFFVWGGDMNILPCICTPKYF